MKIFKISFLSLYLIYLVGFLGCSEAIETHSVDEQPVLKDSQRSDYKLVFQVNAYDPEGGLLSYAIVDQEIDGLFVMTSSGSIILEESKMNIFESREKWIIKVEVKDSHNLATKKDIIINVNR